MEFLRYSSWKLILKIDLYYNICETEKGLIAVATVLVEHQQRLRQHFKIYYSTTTSLNDVNEKVSEHLLFLAGKTNRLEFYLVGTIFGRLPLWWNIFFHQWISALLFLFLLAARWSCYHFLLAPSQPIHSTSTWKKATLPSYSALSLLCQTLNISDSC